MASMAVRCPMDKEQTTCWQENEAPGIANDTFFDQFVTFEAGDATDAHMDSLEDPPSPSLLLDALDYSLKSSTDDARQGFPSSEGMATVMSKGSAGEPSRSEPAALGPPDPVLGAESISDSELLRLEGVSLRSPSFAATLSSSPPLIPTPCTSSIQTGRLAESSNITIRPKTSGSDASTSSMDVIKENQRVETESDVAQLAEMNSPDAKTEPIDYDELTSSPTLISRFPPSQKHSNNMQFSSEGLEDPFYDGITTSLPVVQRTDSRNTTMKATLLAGGPYYQSATQTLDPRNTAYLVCKARNTSSAEWPLEGVMADGSYLWSSDGYMPATSNISSPDFWEDQASSNGSYHQQDRGNSVNMAILNQLGELPFDFSDDLSSLMIHMPQPRPPQAAVLTANVADPLSGNSYHLPPPSHHGRHGERRPQPRASCSGIRHPGSLPTPRKAATFHASPSRPLPMPRDESTSPPPILRRSSTIAVRKQRSWSRRESRTSGSYPGGGGGGGGSSSSISPNSGGTLEGGGGGAVDFVNFTPSDKNILMTGVAPSGSSKTKARREKEAMEKRRRLSEAALKLVEAAGGDVDRLVEEGFVLCD